MVFSATCCLGVRLSVTADAILRSEINERGVSVAEGVHVGVVLCCHYAAYLSGKIHHLALGSDIAFPKQINDPVRLVCQDAGSSYHLGGPNSFYLPGHGIVQGSQLAGDERLDLTVQQVYKYHMHDRIAQVESFPVVIDDLWGRAGILVCRSTSRVGVHSVQQISL